MQNPACNPALSFAWLMGQSHSLLEYYSSTQGRFSVSPHSNVVRVVPETDCTVQAVVQHQGDLPVRPARAVRPLR
jgi:hypothetical protein